MTLADSVWDASTFRANIEATLLDFIDQQAQWIAPVGTHLDYFLDHARTSVRGGKRFRAAFCWWGYQAIVPLDQPEPLLKACAALELLHASALVHDDLMDASDTRRGRPAAHRAFATWHRDQRWNSDADAYGAAGAILLGDALLAWSDELLRTSGFSDTAVLAALRYFDWTRSEVVAGQFLDVTNQARASLDVDDAMTVVRYKSAKYSIERPLHVGAALAGAKPETLTALTQFGLPLGEAFQLRDDLLGVFGDPDTTGKPAGDDLTEGKRTVLIALALDALPSDQAERLHRSLGRPLSPTQVAELCELIDSSGARTQVEMVIEELTQRALAALEQAPIRPEARTALDSLAAAVTQRTL